MEFLHGTHGTQGMAQTVKWSCKPIILSIRHFKGPTRI